MFATAQGLIGVMLGAGLLIGIALACTAAAMALSVGSRAVSGALRSLVLGVVTASGSLGALLSAPLGQMLTDELGWRAGVLGFAGAGARHAAGRLVRRPHRPGAAAAAAAQRRSARPARAALTRGSPARPSW